MVSAPSYKLITGVVSVASQATSALIHVYAEPDYWVESTAASGWAKGPAALVAI
jgi:hypothetical protein